MYPQIVELELWTLPHDAHTPLDGKGVAARCQRETGLPASVVLGLNFIPDATDVQSLRDSLNEDETLVAKFLKFCAIRGLEPISDNERSASEFLAFAEGQAVAWLHLPAEEPGLEMARTLVEWAARNAMQLRHGDGTYEQLEENQVYALWQRSDA